MEKKAFIAFLNDDEQKKEDWVIIKEKTLAFVSFEYNEKLITIPWHRVLKLKEVKEDGE